MKGPQNIRPPLVKLESLVSLSGLLFFLFVELSLVFSGGVLVLLILGDEVVHVGLSFGELHLVHTFTGVPVQEGLATEHGSELFRHSLEQLLDSGAVTDERGRHLETSWWDVAHGCLDVVRDPFDEVAAVLVLDVQHLFVHLHVQKPLSELNTRIAIFDHTRNARTLHRVVIWSKIWKKDFR
jgi:hypothetical protein